MILEFSTQQPFCSFLTFFGNRYRQYISSIHKCICIIVQVGIIRFFEEKRGYKRNPCLRIIMSQAVIIGQQLVAEFNNVLCPILGLFIPEYRLSRSFFLGMRTEYRLEQTYRDARIAAIYEGANGIHERMLATRLLTGAPGDAFEALLAENATGGLLPLWQQARAPVPAPATMASVTGGVTHVTSVADTNEACTSASPKRHLAPAEWLENDAPST